MSSIRTIKRQQWNNEYENNTQKLTVVSWNTLRREYLFRGKYWVPEEYKSWDVRKSMVKDTLSDLNADFLFLEEVELYYIEEDFGDYFRENGYEFLSAVAKNEKEKKDHGHTKPTICWKTSRFELVWSNPRSRAVAASFRDNVTGRTIYVAGCHLMGGRNSYQRYCQAVSLLKVISKQINVAGEDMDNVSIILSGDLNAYADEPVVKLLVGEDMPDADTIEREYPTIPSPSKLNYENQFPLLETGREFFVNEQRTFTFKWGTLEDASYQSIDYIFHSRNLQLEAVLDPLTDEQREEVLQGTGFPNSWHPSDHIPIGATFMFE
eukprot:TRINITY_DN8627_c0_g1_i1.p1 TRINITY_DN8627_c0_g1~~TRINITY_DN8627_c0_g1_i1.p1  ORF type:complete len:322 (+),score=77.59 TRINITY_DN8627_c0_g1_i1:76-1041(+)